MALTVGTNSYISVVDADNYFATRLNSNAWNNADIATQEAALIQATRTLDALYDWNGSLADDDQSLGWPRIDAYDCEGRIIDSTAIPECVENATCEEALHLLSGDVLTTPSLLTQGFKKAKLGSMEIEVADSASTATPDKVSTMARDMLSCIGTPKSGAVSGGGYSSQVIRG